MTIPDFISLPYALERAAPPFEANAIKSPEVLMRWVLETFTKLGAKVFDPFAGLGTLLFVAEEMKRNPFGIEADPQRYEWVAGQLEHWQQMWLADSADIKKLGLPKMDFCMTSPPYMAITHQWNPLYAGDPAKAGYAAYLKRMRVIFAEVEKVMKKGALVVVQVDNIPGRSFTPLVRDLSSAISASLTPIGETVVKWENAPKDYSHTRCLVFKKR